MSDHIVAYVYFEQANPFGKVGWLIKRLTDFSDVKAFVNDSYVTIEDILRERAADFVD